MIPSVGLEAHPYKVKYIENPTQPELRALALRYTPAVFQSSTGNLNKISRNKARMARFTYVVAAESDRHLYSGNIISGEKAAELIALQRRYIENQGELIQIDRYQGVGDRAYPVQWLYSREGANIAGMQQILTFPRSAAESPEQLERPFRPLLRLVYTPDCFPEEMPGRQAIVVDLENWTTYVMGPDYFGESKKGVLRMLNAFVYGEGGLVLHAGAKLVRSGGQTLTVAVLGLSGTGKTTTTFSKQGETAQPIQDDMVCLWPGGTCTVTENGCFAKTYGLTAETEPALYHGTLHPDAWVENAYQNADGSYDFSKGALTPEEVRHWRDVFVTTGSSAEDVDAYISGAVRFEDIVDEYGTPNDGWDFVVWTQNGRSIIPMSVIPDAAGFTGLPPIQSMGMLNRDEGSDAATPGIVRFSSPEQAAGYFMLGETSKTSAAGKERGKTRSPFTQPFFPRAHGLQATRFKEIAATMPGTDMWLMNTGYIGGDQRDAAAGKALKVKIAHSSAMLEALFSGSIKWRVDPDFGYQVADTDAPENAELLNRVPAEILNPRLYFEKQNRLGEYDRWVGQMKHERRAFLESFDVDPAIISAVVG